MKLQDQYNDWRKAGEEASKGTDVPFTYDCGESSARNDFAEWCGLDEVSFEDMLECERNYK